MVDKTFLAVNVSNESPYSVINRNILVKTADKIISAFGRNFTAGGHIDVHSECGDGFIGMIFGISMHGNMGLVRCPIRNLWYSISPALNYRREFRSFY